MENDEQAIRGLVNTWFSATTSGDIETILNLMTEDVIFMVAGQEPFGREVFEAAAKQQQNMKIDGKNEIKEIKIMGDYAYIRTFIKINMTTEEKNIIKRSGYTLSVLHKGIDGKWRIARDANLLTLDD